jgi:hypothetical protein
MPRTPKPVAPAPLAYENHTFINSPDGRVLRILSEYSEPLARFRRERIRDTVVFYGSARFRALDEAHHELELLENTGSVQPAPQEEQPASPPELEQGTASELSRRRAQAAVEMAHYVISDEMTVTPPPPTVAQLTEDKFKAALQAHQELASQDISYEAKDGTLILSGRVHTAHQRAEAVKLAKAVPNVERVVDEIKVKP